MESEDNFSLKPIIVSHKKNNSYSAQKNLNRSLNEDYMGSISAQGGFNSCRDNNYFNKLNNKYNT